MFMKDHDWGCKMESAERPKTLEQSWMQHWLIHFNSFLMVNVHELMFQDF